MAADTRPPASPASHSVRREGASTSMGGSRASARTASSRSRPPASRVLCAMVSVARSVRTQACARYLAGGVRLARQSRGM